VGLASSSAGLTKDEWTTVTLGGLGNPLTAHFTYQTLNPGVPCETMADCLDSDRFVQVMAHAAVVPITLTL